MYVLTPQKYLLPHEQEALEILLHRHRNDLRNTTMLLLMLKTGARPREVLNLTWGDITFATSVIFIKTLKRGNDRMIPIGKDLCRRFKDLGPGEPSERIFKIKYNMFRNIWVTYRPVKKKLHSLRHTFAKNIYLKSGHDVKGVQQALGHRSLLTTSIYLEYETSVSDLRRYID